MYRLILVMESRIRRNVYVRFGGEYLETYCSNTTTRRILSLLQPIIASIIAILIGQDVFSWDKPIAALLVFTGVYLVTQSKAKEEVKGIK